MPYNVTSTCNRCEQSNMVIIPAARGKDDRGDEEAYCLPCWYAVYNEQERPVLSKDSRLRLHYAAAVVGESVWCDDNDQPFLAGYSGVLLSVLCHGLSSSKRSAQLDVVLAASMARLLHLQKHLVDGIQPRLVYFASDEHSPHPLCVAHVPRPVSHSHGVSQRDVLSKRLAVSQFDIIASALCPQCYSSTLAVPQWVASNTEAAAAGFCFTEDFSMLPLAQARQHLPYAISAVLTHLGPFIHRSLDLKHLAVLLDWSPYLLATLYADLPSRTDFAYATLRGICQRDRPRCLQAAIDFMKIHDFDLSLVDGDDGRDSCLFSAIHSGSDGCVDVLLKCGCSLDVTQFNFETFQTASALEVAENLVEGDRRRVDNSEIGQRRRRIYERLKEVFSQRSV